MSQIDAAIAFAAQAHAGQKRKYTGEPYVFHPIETCRILLDHNITDDDTLVGAILHDTVEDCPGVTHETIERRFGSGVASIVFDLTKQYFDGNRAARMKAEAVRLWSVSEKAQNVKAADLISNTKNIVEHSPGFARIYLPEKREVLRGMKLINAELRLTAERSLVMGVSALLLQDLHDGK